MTVIRAAAVQLSPVLYSREGTVQRVVDKIEQLFSFVQRPFEMRLEHLRRLDQAVTIPSPAVDAISAAAPAANNGGIHRSQRARRRFAVHTQLLFDADGTLIQRRRKITPTYHERMVWGQGDGSGLRAVDSAVGRIGQLAWFEHFNPLAR